MREKADVWAIADMPRRKPRRPVLAISYRLYRVLRSLLPRRALARLLLAAEWLVERVAMEQVGYWLGPEAGMATLRPQSAALIREEAAGARRALDFGGGLGAFTKVLAEVVDEVTYADLSSRNLGVARHTCAGLTNVSFVLGNGLDVVRDRGPFDVVCAMHVLEHLDDPVAALRTLRDNCDRLLLEVPDFESQYLAEIRRREGLPYYTDDDHVTEFTADSLTYCLETADWGIARLEKAHGTLSAVALSSRQGTRRKL